MFSIRPFELTTVWFILQIKSLYICIKGDLRKYPYLYYGWNSEAKGGSLNLKSKGMGLLTIGIPRAWEEEDF